MDTPPILFLIFNRPKHASKVFESIKRARPAKLYIACDGARQGRPDDIALISETLKVINNIDWPCTVSKLIRDENLGCKRAVSQAISWFFDQEEYGIILEDDCLPNPSFFDYCANLLHTYKEDNRVMHITGTNLQNGNIRGDGSYYFSKVCHIWGWASWRRAWAMYDLEMTTYPKFKQANYIQTAFPQPKHHKYWYNSFDKTFAGMIDTWDYQWVYTVWSNNGLCINPQVNLISNIGFDESATHTRNSQSIYSNRDTYQLDVINHPTFVLQNTSADDYSMKMFTGKPPLNIRFKNKFLKVQNKLKGLFPKGATN